MSLVLELVTAVLTASVLLSSPYVERMPRRLSAGIRIMKAFPRLAERSDLGVLTFAF